MATLIFFPLGLRTLPSTLYVPGGGVVTDFVMIRGELAEPALAALIATPMMAKSAELNVQDMVVDVPEASSVLMSSSGALTPALSVCPAPTVAVDPEFPRMSTTKSSATEVTAIEADVPVPLSVAAVPTGVD